MSEKVISLEGIPLIEFLGAQNKHIKYLASAFPKSKIIARGDEIKLIGSTNEVAHIGNLIEMLLDHYNRYGSINTDNVEDYISLERSHPGDEDSDVIIFGNKGAVIKAKTDNQRALVKTIKDNDVTFAVGPAGTGKTFLAVALAVDALKKKSIRKIVITRPAVEAGESLGFLPGDMKEKIDPYLRPIYDSLEILIPSERLKVLLEQGTIEIAPLAFMRGRTLNDSFVLLDEAQNSTQMQLKMFLTRLGLGSKMVITGDISQIDLPKKQHSGLLHARRLLKNIKGLSWVELDGSDVVRHRVVRQIIKAYDQEEE